MNKVSKAKYFSFAIEQRQLRNASNCNEKKSSILIE